MELTESAEFQASPEEVFAILTDEAFQHAKCEATSHGVYSAEVTRAPNRTTVKTSRQLSSEGLPEAARAFVGHVVHINEVQVWGRPEPDGSRRGTLDLHITGAPLTFKGHVVLTPTGAGTTQKITATVKANVPFIGGRIEKAATRPIAHGMRTEFRLVRERLGQ